MISKKRVTAAALAAVFIAGFAAGAPPAAQAAEGKKTVRPAVGKPVLAAQAAMKQKKYKEALAKLSEADAVPDKTAYEKYVIEATRGPAYVSSGDLRDAAKSYETIIGSGQEPAAMTTNRLLALVGFNYQLKNYPKVVEYTNRYYKEGGTSDQPRLLVAQSYYLAGDYAGASRALRGIIDADRKAGRATSETLLQMWQSAEYQQHNSAGVAAALEDLVAAYPKKQYWSDVLTAIQRKPGFQDRLALDVAVLSSRMGVLSKESDYMDASQLALAKGLPGIAKGFVDQAFASGAFGKGAQAEREKRLAALAAKQVTEDHARLPEEAKAAAAAPDGKAWVTLGDAYASYGEYAPAIAAYQKGIAKGGLKFPDDSRLHLGIAFAGAGQAEKAASTFRAVQGTDGTGDLAHLWSISLRQAPKGKSPKSAQD